jgi:hypothetical protein
MKEKTINKVTKCMHGDNLMCVIQDERNSTSMKKGIWNRWLLFDFILMMCLCKAHNYMNGAGEVDWLQYSAAIMACIAKQKMEQMYPCRYHFRAVVNNLLRMHKS